MPVVLLQEKKTGIVPTPAMLGSCFTQEAIQAAHGEGKLENTTFVIALKFGTMACFKIIYSLKNFLFIINHS